MAQEGISIAQGTGATHRFRVEPGQPTSDISTPATSTQQTSPQQSGLQSNSPSTSSEQPVLNPTSKSPNIDKSSAAESSTASNPGPLKQVSVPKDLSLLSSLQPSQVAEILCNNPEIQGIVWAAVDQAMAQARDET